MNDLTHRRTHLAGASEPPAISEIAIWLYYGFALAQPDSADRIPAPSAHLVAHLLLDMSTWLPVAT